MKRNKQIRSFESVNWRDNFHINTHLDWQYYYQQHGRHQRKLTLLCLFRYFHWEFLLDLLLKEGLLYVDDLELILLFTIIKKEKNSKNRRFFVHNCTKKINLKTVPWRYWRIREINILQTKERINYKGIVIAANGNQQIYRNHYLHVHVFLELIRLRKFKLFIFCFINIY